jgi:hypothetical protein
MAENTEKLCCICLTHVLFQKSNEPSFNPGCCGQTFHMSCTLSLINSFKFTKPTCPYCRASLNTNWILNKSSSEKSIFSQYQNYVYKKWLLVRSFLIRNETPMAFMMCIIYICIFTFWVSSKNKS